MAAAVPWILGAGLGLQYKQSKALREQAATAQEFREREAAKAEQRSKDHAAKVEAMRVAENLAKKTRQRETIVKSPFANKKKKGTMRSQFTIGGGGSDSGVNY